ncbi:cellulose synthase catalytic subunit (UDP-forming), partial [Rhizobium ruizarguesonis]
VRNIEPSGDISNVGCQYVPKIALDHLLIADLMFANSDQWTEFQASRRRNPGLIRGTVWFLGIDIVDGDDERDDLYRKDDEERAADLR